MTTSELCKFITWVEGNELLRATLDTCVVDTILSNPAHADSNMAMSNALHATLTRDLTWLPWLELLQGRRGVAVAAIFRLAYIAYTRMGVRTNEARTKLAEAFVAEWRAKQEKAKEKINE